MNFWTYIYYIIFAILIIVGFFVLYKFLKLFRKRAATYFFKEDRYVLFGLVKRETISSKFTLNDLTQPIYDRYQGYSSNDENKKSKIYLKDEDYCDCLNETLPEAGYIDLDGNIFDKNHKKQGYVADENGKFGFNGTTKWYEFWLIRHTYVYSIKNGEPDCIGKIKEYGRFKKAKANYYTLTARAGCFTILYKNNLPKSKADEHKLPQNIWHDTALLSSLIYFIAFTILYVSNLTLVKLPALGEQIGFAVIMVIFYFITWAIVREYKIEKSLRGNSIEHLLILLNRNTGVYGMTTLILILTVIALIVSIFAFGSDLVPLFLALLVGVIVNRKYYPAEPWKLKIRNSNDRENEETEEEDTDVLIERNYKWKLDSNFAKGEGDFSLFFNATEIEKLRSGNPFIINQQQTHYEKAAQLFKLLNEEHIDAKNLNRLIHYIDEVANKNNFCELDKMQFILDFVQVPNIKYEFDENCEEIFNCFDYARFPYETLYDKRGDCDCKAVLAAALFFTAKYKTAYIITENPDNNGHAAVAVAFPNQISNIDSVDAAIINNGIHYFFCETTGDGFKIGDFADTRKENIKEIIYLN